MNTYDTIMARVQLANVWVMVAEVVKEHVSDQIREHVSDQIRDRVMSRGVTQAKTQTREHCKESR